MAITAPPPSIFKAYDIRGIYGEEMDAGTAHLIGRGFARVLARLRGKEPGELRVGLGRDMRLSAPEMSAAVREGLVEEGVTVIDAGQGATEMAYFLVRPRHLEVTTTYWEPDGNFPDREPNPLLEENRRFIVDHVKAEAVDLAIAWDGDADRCFFIDSDGSFCDGDFVCALLAQAALAKEPGA